MADRRFRQLLVKRIAADRGLDPAAITVDEVRMFPGHLANRWGDVGEIEVTYNTAGHRAIYGFNAIARIQIYMD